MAEAVIRRRRMVSVIGHHGTTTGDTSPYTACQWLLIPLATLDTTSGHVHNSRRVIIATSAFNTIPLRHDIIVLPAMPTFIDVEHFERVTPRRRWSHTVRLSPHETWRASPDHGEYDGHEMTGPRHH